MNYALLSVYLISVALQIATPGPVVAFVLHAAARGGFRQALLAVCGTNGASLVLISLAALAIMGVFTIDHDLLSWISLAGCVFLGRMAIIGLRSELAAPKKVDIEAPPVPSARIGDVMPILQGFLIGISNPKDIIFLVAFFPQFVGITSRVKLSLAMLTVLWLLCDFLILLGYVTLMHTDAFRRRKRWISTLSSGFLLIVAVVGFIYTVMRLTGQNAAL